MSTYNFANKYNSLSKWKFTKKKEEIKTTQQILPQKYLSYLPIINKILKENRILYYPTLLILAFSLFIHLISVFPLLNIKRLESNHFLYEDNVSRINSLNQDLEEDVQKLKDHSTLFVNSAHSFLFAYYLQQSIPPSVQISEYTLDSKGFRLLANSPQIDNINKMVSLFVESPLIEQGSIKITRLLRQQNPESPQPSNLNTKALIEISGRIRKFGLNETYEMHKASYNYGYVRKLARYIELVSIMSP